MTTHPNIWYFPSAFGDIRLEQAEGSSSVTRVIFYSLTPREAEALEGLRKKSLHWRRKWATQEDWDRVRTEGAFKVGDRTEHHILLKADLQAIAPILNKELNPDRRTLHVMRIGQGKIEEIREEKFAAPESEVEARQEAVAQDANAQARYAAEQKKKEEAGAPHRKEANLPAVIPKTAPAKAVTVKEPIRGCPPPDFAAITRRATRVLKAFLTPVQISDYEKHQRFIVRGADTGHRYMLTSRNAPDQLACYGSRTVYDMTEGRAYCVHDWDVPAEEELLSLAMLL